MIFQSKTMFLLQLGKRSCYKSKVCKSIFENVLVLNGVT